ncbi:MAG: hypothetical protein EXR73_01035 [Myxococcales bacterium]|nr:hypothetical protein [Myxococcales bacterium]
MRVRLLTFRYSATLGGFDDTPLVELLRDKELISFREHFFAVNEVPHLTCVVTWQEALVPTHRIGSGAAVGAVPSAAASGRTETAARARFEPTPQGHPAAELDEPQRLLFNSLREWRATTARAEGVPPFLVFTNRQLAWIATQRPESANSLANGHGIGPSKTRRYAEAVLRVLHGPRPVAAPEPGVEFDAPARAGPVPPADLIVAVLTAAPQP